MLQNQIETKLTDHLSSISKIRILRFETLFRFPLVMRNTLHEQSGRRRPACS